jgi:LPS export ABC transporter protein LptC
VVNLFKILKISIVSAFLGAMLFSCENDISVVQSLQLDENVPIETSFDVESIITDSGRVRIRIKSPRIDHFQGEEDYTEMPDGVNVIFFDSLGNITSSIKADYAINTPAKHRILAKYNVVATNADGEKLYTEKLIWDKKTRKIYTDADVKVVSDDKVIFGDGFTADETFDNWVIKHPHGDFETEGIEE